MLGGGANFIQKFALSSLLCFHAPPPLPYSSMKQARQKRDVRHEESKMAQGTAPRRKSQRPRLLEDLLQLVESR